jgi:hypothetical protein
LQLLVLMAWLGLWLARCCCCCMLSASTDICYCCAAGWWADQELERVGNHLVVQVQHCVWPTQHQGVPRQQHGGRAGLQLAQLLAAVCAQGPLHKGAVE